MADPGIATRKTALRHSVLVARRDLDDDGIAEIAIAYGTDDGMTVYLIDDAIAGFGRIE